MATCPQCTGTTKTGGRCRRTTCRYAPFCAAHKAFRVGDSTLPDAGKGAFAARALKRGDTVGDYTIATLAQTEVELLETYPDKRATHTGKIDGTYYTALGTGKRTHNAIGMANRAPKGRRNNARILASGRVVASKKIPMDSEIFLAYGSGYRI